jgi:micrococcal nuclease
MVSRAIDGDTVELSDGRLVRYIGVDTPEVRRRKNGAWVLDPEPFAEAARDANAAWVQGKRVKLEYDVERHDRYGRLLAYVYVDGEMVNEKLVREGYAKTLTIPPNVAYAEVFRGLAADARRMKRGLWAEPERARR